MEAWPPRGPGDQYWKVDESVWPGDLLVLAPADQVELSHLLVLRRGSAFALANEPRSRCQSQGPPAPGGEGVAVQSRAVPQFVHPTAASTHEPALGVESLDGRADPALRAFHVPSDQVPRPRRLLAVESDFNHKPCVQQSEKALR